MVETWKKLKLGWKILIGFLAVFTVVNLAEGQSAGAILGDNMMLLFFAGFIWIFFKADRLDQED